MTAATVPQREPVPPEVLRVIKQVEIKARILADEALVGTYRSVFRGSGLDFEEVREYEPEVALFASDRGFAVIDALIDSGPRLLRSGGRLITEVGSGQAPEVVARLEQTGCWTGIRVLADLAGIERVVIARVGR